MGKSINKMNKKELIEKIKQLEEEKEEAEYKEKEFGSFICALKLWEVFINMINEERETGRSVIDLTEVKKAINEIKCPKCENGGCANCEAD